MQSGQALLPRHVFVDLETTGLDPACDEVIELGALFVREDREITGVERLFRPDRPVPPFVSTLTGIQAHQLSAERPFAELAAPIGRLLRGWTVVAHNAGFERAFLSGILRAETAVLDSCELLHYLYPELQSHSLGSLVRWAQLGAEARHRALGDCRDTHGVLRYAFARCLLEGRAGELRELVDCLQTGAREALTPDRLALLAVLERLATRCEELPQPTPPLPSPCLEGALEACAVPSSQTPELAAARAYLRARLHRECLPSTPLSHWFLERYPALEEAASQVLRVLAKGCNHLRSCPIERIRSRCALPDAARRDRPHPVLLPIQVG